MPPKETFMFAAMAMSTAKAGSEEALAQAALDHARALRQQPGCVMAYVLQERGTSAQVSLSIFETEEAFERGMEATRSVIAKHGIERLRDGASTFRLFDVR
jgi:heme-degrading monooxygenase HmoA